METLNEIGTDVDLRFTSIAVRLSIVMTYIAILRGKIQISKPWSHFQKSDAIKASHLSKHVVVDDTSSKRVRDDSKEEFKLYSACLENEDTRLQGKKKLEERWVSQSGRK